jgi:methyl-accepting chemotaxis protein
MFKRLFGKTSLSGKDHPAAGLKMMLPSRKKSSELSKTISHLTALNESLESIMGAVEPQFLKLGDNIQGLHADANQLSEMTSTSARSIGGEECGQSCMADIDALARTSLERLRECRGAITGSLKNIENSLTHLGKLRDICATIEKTGMVLNVVGLNIAIESRRSLESRDLFEVFTEEIRGLSRKISHIAKNILQDSSMTRSTQLGAHDSISTGLKEFEHLYDRAVEVVEDAVKDIREIIDVSEQTFQRSNTHSQEIFHQVGQVVVAIQFHDITRQKIEHIIHALKDVEKICQGGMKMDNGGDIPVEVLSHRILALQAEQLDQVVRDIRTVHDQCRQAFETLILKIEALVEDASVFERTGEKENRIQDRMTALKAGLEQLGGLLDQGNDLEGQIRSMAGQVAKTATTLSEHINQVRGISMDLHLKALNAIVKSTRLDAEGRALEILAQEVSKISKQSHDIVMEVVTVLESLSKLAAGMEKNEYEGVGGSSLAIGIGVQGITSHYEKSEDKITAALKDARVLKSEILTTQDELTFLIDLAERISIHQTQLEKIIIALEPHADVNVSGMAEQIEQIARRYTMSSERQVHKQYLGGNDPSAAADPLQIPGKGTEGEDLGDNVELF